MFFKGDCRLAVYGTVYETLLLSPVMVGCAQYGLTSRLTKIAGTDTLHAAGFHSEQAEFPIAPGRQTLELNDGRSNPVLHPFILGYLSHSFNEPRAGG